MNMSTQEIIVYLVVLGCAGWIISHIFSFVKKTKKGESPCDSCASGCELRDQFKQKQMQCDNEVNKKNKKSE